MSNDKGTYSLKYVSWANAFDIYLPKYVSWANAFDIYLPKYMSWANAFDIYLLKYVSLSNFFGRTSPKCVLIRSERDRSETTREAQAHLWCA